MTEYIEQSDLGAAIAQFYVEKVREQAGWYTMNNKVKIAGEKAAVQCKKAGAHPKDFVAAQFARFAEMGTIKGTMPTTFLYAINATKNYEDFMQHAEVQEEVSYARSFNAQKHYLLLAVNSGNWTVEQVLLDHLLDFTPWFRMSVTKNSMPAVTAKYGEKAKAQITDDLVSFLKEEGLNYEWTQK